MMHQNRLQAVKEGTGTKPTHLCHCRAHGAADPGMPVAPDMRPVAAHGAIVPVEPGAAADVSLGAVIGNSAPPSSTPCSPAALVHGK